MTEPSDHAAQCGAELIVKNLVAHGVTHVFGIPGAKVDRLFDALVDSPIETVVTRHEQNAAFIAGGLGRLTGKAGVAIATSGPGASNFVTGLATANSEGDPVLAIGGAVKLADRLKLTHQTMDTVSLFKPITKYSVEITNPLAISEVMANAFRFAESGRPGASFVSTPMDVLSMPANAPVLADRAVPKTGPAAADTIAEAARLLKNAKRPVVLLGLLASRPDVAEAVRAFVATTGAPVVGTYQAAGAVSHELVDRFGGRVGLFRNQHGDQLLHEADVVVTIGYNPVEYDPWLWNVNDARKIINIDIVAAELDNAFVPVVELVGEIAPTVKALAQQAGKLTQAPELETILEGYKVARAGALRDARSTSNTAVHPLQIVRELEQIVTPDVTLCLDMGTFHIWLARYLLSFRARQVLISNGQQTMGVGLPWGIAASLLNPAQKVISISGDGGFMMSSMELETAVRLKCNLIHMVWIDQAYNMVEMQEKKKYGRGSGVEFGPIDFAKYAEACGATGMTVTSADGVGKALKAAMDIEGPVVIAVPVDYSQNHLLMKPLAQLGETSAAA
ncbi:acetolactate synthase AlsS [Acetobacter orleanensis]|uniref:Acetolactate synthase n=1 Tax=Acetobacter orleanensis TaxID=104099 RepID=A0A4Y3TL17_9PROT|nr:acetolactate synthase AlsS [Acetobacter orleanensis]KXV66238.1 acetolactate synthase [Acetobacter orleanensis]PCD78586.1 acetolactate synthase AlsS [Acetobacter orleanensis]GAN69885.1 acetolactate synthase large subunit [Acetobacter orleanensis JCM 7639]GBR31048.1 acetolactate synthase large subunit [Acetobacter orleanensis NRIC 0473]GEB83681.1 acetolactate synthase [Acetobacter orleanensis]